MGDIDRQCYDLISGAGMESVLMPRKQFVKEHKNLLKVLKSGDPKLLKKEYKEQKKELEGMGLAEDKRYINSKTPFTLAKEMSKKELMMYRDDPGVPPSMKDKLEAAMEMKGGRQHLPQNNDLFVPRHPVPPLPPQIVLNPPIPTDMLNENQIEAFLNYYDAFPELEDMWMAEGGDTPYDALMELINFDTLPDEEPDVVANLVEAVVDQFEGYATQLNGGWKGSQAAGFVRRMMAEVKKKHKGEPYGDKPRISSYKKPTRPLAPGSTMKKPVPFDYSKLQREEDGGKNDDEAWGPSPFIVERFGSGKEEVEKAKQREKKLREERKKPPPVRKAKEVKAELPKDPMGTLKRIDYKGKQYYINPTPPYRLFIPEGTYDPQVGWTNYKGIGYAGIGEFVGMKFS